MQSHLLYRRFLGAVLLALAAYLPIAVGAQSAPAPTKKFEVKNDRAYLGGREIKLWGIRGGNALMSPAVTERFGRNFDNLAAHGINGFLLTIMGTNTGWPEEWAARNGFGSGARGFVGRQSLQCERMDRAAHQITERRVDHAMSRQRQFAGEGCSHHARFEMHAVVALHADFGVGQPGLDQITDSIGVHG